MTVWNGISEGDPDAAGGDEDGCGEASVAGDSLSPKDGVELGKTGGFNDSNEGISIVGLSEIE